MNDCIEWDGPRNAKGYGQKIVSGKTWKAHRLTWTLANGDIPDGMIVMHICDNPPCININHLKLGTSADNSADRDAKGRAGGWAEENRRKTHCSAGHALDSVNIYITPSGARQCRICQRENVKKYRLRKSGN